MQAVTRTACFAVGLRPCSISVFILTNNCRRLSVGSSCLERTVSTESDASLRPTRRATEDNPRLFRIESATKAAMSDASLGIESDDAGETMRCLGVQAPNPPLPLSPDNPHPIYQGINANAAAIAYLRAKGLASHPRRRWFFYLLCWVLRHAARDLGFAIAPDGFVRIFDLLRFEPFQRHTIKSFAKVVIGDKFDRFEVITLPDFVDGEIQDVWWVRARASHSMPGVKASNKRIINMGKLQTVAYQAPLKDWQSIQKYGIREGPTRIIPLHQIGGPYFGNIIPEQSKYICITIDAQRAAELGVTFFHTSDAELLAVGRNGVIPTQVIRSVVKLDLKKEKLL